MVQGEGWLLFDSLQPKIARNPRSAQVALDVFRNMQHAGAKEVCLGDEGNLQACAQGS